MIKFTNQSLFEIINILKSLVDKLKTKEIIEFEVLNPDITTSKYAGSIILVDNTEYVYRGFKAWVDLAEILYCKILTPVSSGKNKVIISFEKLNTQKSFHKSQEIKEEKYGTNSTFSQIVKTEEPAFLMYYLNALKNVNINKRLRILNIGINKADEFEIIRKYATNFKNMELVGIDYCKSAIAEAKQLFDSDNVSFISCDINKMDTLNLDKFDLIISIGTLQSTSINFTTTFMSLVQNYLKKDGAMILGFPNCRWIDGEMIYGAKAKNYSYPEMSLLYKDANFCKKYLQQKKFRVTLTGKDYIFLTATSIAKSIKLF